MNRGVLYQSVVGWTKTDKLRHSVRVSSHQGVEVTACWKPTRYSVVDPAASAGMNCPECWLEIDAETAAAKLRDEDDLVVG